jgi:membrane-associated phospholipid phosphatase
MIKKILAYIGAFSPLYLFFISLLLLRNYKNYMSFYVIGIIINTILNLTLKSIIKQPRPDEDYKMVLIGTVNGHRFGPDIYGMPSGHAQNCAFNLIFITYVFKSPLITCCYLVITIITLCQRYIYNNHTISQLLVGLLFGSIIGVITYYYANKRVKGYINEKEDDNGPL